MTIQVITPLNRLQNFVAQQEMLRPHGVIWNVIMDQDSPFRLLYGEDWVVPYIFPNPQSTFYARSNHSLNSFLAAGLDDETHYCFLNDDDAYEPGFFDKVRQHDDDVIMVSMQRGQHTPGYVPPERAHGTDELVAAPENMVVGRVSIEQIIVRGRILKHCRLPLTIAGDGEMIQYIVANNPVKYTPDAKVWFNYYEPGRWDK